jgi:ubiquitin-conjugating enzyme E2 J2
MKSSDEEKKRFAQASHAWNVQQPKFKSIFPEYSGKEMKDVPNMVKPKAAAAGGVENKVSRCPIRSSVS